MKNTSAINIDIEGSEKYLGDLFKYMSKYDTSILLSLHPPFWEKDKEIIINNLIKSFEKYTIICPFEYKEIKKYQR